MAQQPTTRWRDPDTGKLIGSPDAAIAHTTPVSHKFTYPTAEAERRRDEALAAAEAPAAVAVAPEAAEIEEIKATIRELGAAAKAGNAEAKTALAGLRDAEYARPNGGRSQIKRALTSAGYGRPS